MPSTNKENKYFIYLWIIAFFCLVSVLISLFVSFVFSDNLSEDKFVIEGIMIPNVSNTEDNMQIIALTNQTTTSKEKNELLKNFLKEYIVNRYTVSGSAYEMQNNLGLQDLNSLSSGFMLKYPSYRGIKNNEILWTDAYENFKNGKDGELAEINELMKNNTTRSVRILGEPKKNGDWWSVPVEFIYKTPINYSVENTRREKYQIDLDIIAAGFRDIKSIKQGPASSIIKIYVMYIKKTKI